MSNGLYYGPLVQHLFGCSLLGGEGGSWSSCLVHLVGAASLLKQSMCYRVNVNRSCSKITAGEHKAYYLINTSFLLHSVQMVSNDQERSRPWRDSSCAHSICGVTIVYVFAVIPDKLERCLKP